MRVCTVTTLRATLGETLDFVNYHLNIGIDQMYLFFDDPNDPSVEKIKGKRVTCISCNSAHWDFVGCKADDNIEVRQRRNANLALQWAKNEGFDWISHIDSDELIYVNDSLKTVLSELSVETVYLKLPTKEAVPETLDYLHPYREISLFKTLPTLDHQYYLNQHKAAFFNNEYFRGHIVGKSIVRVKDKVETLSLHAPELKNREPPNFKILTQASLLHFDCYDFSSWCLKWERRLNGIAKSGGRENRMRQKLYFKSIKQEKTGEEAMKKAFMEMHFLPPSLIHGLLKDKMLERILIPKSMFQCNFS